MQTTFSELVLVGGTVPNPRVILTADRSVMTEYNGFDSFGFFLCLPHRVVPRPLLYRILAPPVKTDVEMRAQVAPYNIRKIEAALLEGGFREDEVFVTTPEKLGDVVSSETNVVGLSVLDPLGKAPVSYTLVSLLGGGSSCTAFEFTRLITMVTQLKQSFRFKVIVGGPGSWQLRGLQSRLGIDCIVHGEGELVFPQLCRVAVEGGNLPEEVDGGSVSLDQIPVIRGPSRGGLVQITRGCPRRCQFCNPTMFDFRSIPLDMVLEEVRVNVNHGFKQVSFISEDGLSYGAQDIKVNPDAVLNLVKHVNSDGYTTIGGFTHIAIPSVRQVPGTICKLNEMMGFSKENPWVGPQVGLETGSPRLIEKFMSGKPRPWNPSQWPDIAVEAASLMDENYWYPCYTLIVGLPGETEDDVVKTIELIDRLKSLRVKGWFFPLLMVPMGGSVLENKDYPDVKLMSGQAWELIYECYKYSIWFGRQVYRTMFNAIRHPLARRLSVSIMEKALSFCEENLYDMKSDPERVVKYASRVNLNSPRSVLGLVTALPRLRNSRIT